MKHSVTIRQSLLGNLVLLTLVLGCGILLTTVLAARRTVRSLSEMVITGTLAGTEAELRRFFDPVTTELVLVRNWGEQGLLAGGPDNLNELFLPMIERFAQISSLLVADDRGREYMLLNTGDEWRMRETRRDEWGDRIRISTWSSDLSDKQVVDEVSEYDPRLRPWWKTATRTGANPDKIQWTEPYVFFTTKEPGITASIRFDPGDGHIHVVAFDMLLRDISTFTRSLAVTSHGGVMVLTEDGRVLGLPHHIQLDNERAHSRSLLKRTTELEWSLATDATQAFLIDGEEMDAPIRFESEGEPWWIQVRPFRLGDGRHLLIAVVIPESDLLGHLTHIRLWIIGVTVIVLGGAIVRVVFLSRRFSEPIESLVVQSERMSHGDLEFDLRTRSHFKEIRQLNRAQERMRRGLRSLLKLEGDLQLARQIQQSTFPDTLPVLDGYAIGAWSEPAEETGGDVYDVIEVPPGFDVTRLADSPASEPKDSKVMMLLADATGHGVGPALAAAQIRSMLRMAVRLHGSLRNVAQHLNEQLYSDLPDDRFITAWLGELVCASNTLLCFSAGQAPLLHVHAKQRTVESLPADVPPFGILEDLSPEKLRAIRLERGDLFAVFSDGIFEACNRAGEQFGLRAVSDLLLEYRKRTPQAILEVVRQRVSEFAAGMPAADDQTAVIIKRHG